MPFSWVSFPILDLLSVDLLTNMQDSAWRLRLQGRLVATQQESKTWVRADTTHTTQDTEPWPCSYPWGFWNGFHYLKDLLLSETIPRENKRFRTCHGIDSLLLDNWIDSSGCKSCSLPNIARYAIKDKALNFSCGGPSLIHLLEMRRNRAILSYDDETD